MSEPDIWTSLEAERMASAEYDPLRGMSLQDAAGMDTRHFTAESYVEPETSWLTNLWQPWDDFGQNLWGATGQAVEYTSEKLPELLWERGLREVGLLPKQRVVREGAGVTVVHTQAPQAGGTPAQPLQKILPGLFPVYAPGAAPKAAVLSGSVMLVVGLVLFILLRK